MSKQCKLVDPGEWHASQTTQPPKPSTNWDLCVLCQKDTTERLVNPAESKFLAKGKECGYKLLAENIIEFQKLGSLPLNIDIKRLDDGSGIEATFKSNNAKWHKTCSNRYDKQKLQRAQKRKATEDSKYGPSPVKTRKSGVGSMARSSNCFFCDKDDSQEPLHNAQTDRIDARVSEYAQILQDRKLLGKLSEGDMHALDARYHLSCLTLLSNRVRKHNRESMNTEVKSKIESLVLGELVSYIEECRQDEPMPVFKLSDLGRLYESRLKEQDPDFTGKVNTTRLKERLLCFIPDLRAQTQGREVILMFDAHVGEAIKIACSLQKADDDAIHLVRAAQILRKDILQKDFAFDGTLKVGCEKEAVPESVLALIRMILRGPSIQSQKETSDTTTKVALSLSQLLMFNVKKSSKKGEKSKVRHDKRRETPLAIYTGLMIHAKTRKKGLIEKLSSRGLCISYERIQEIISGLASSVCLQYERDGCVCPSRLKKDLFTVGAVDNIDHNPSARNAMESFHGTAISIIQFPTNDKLGTDRDTIAIDTEADSRNKVCQLPAEYSQIAPVSLPQTDFFPPASDNNVEAESTIMSSSREKENSWLSVMAELILEKEQIEPGDFVSWSAYHANRQEADIRPVSPIFLMPLFTEPANSVAMIAHAMKLVADAIEHLHPGQSPVITMDQPLYSIAKQIQWTWPDTFAEDKFVVMMGGLHIEMNVMKLLGDFLTGSGWTAVLVQSEVTTSGRAEAILKGSHVTRSRYVHQVTAATLHLLQVSAFQKYIDSIAQEDEQLDFKSWSSNKATEVPQFQYWALVLELELLALQFVRSFREADFDLYIQCLGQLVPWMFALDHTNYARWLPIHIKDMVQLKEKVPSVFEAFKNGNFVVQKSAHVFSTMALDQAHEQMNELIKGDGGVIGITDNPSALIKWITAGPEVARIIEDFESTPVSKGTHHHDQEFSVQTQFTKHVKAMVEVFEELGNPFIEDSKDLIVLDTKEVLSDGAVESVRTVETIGQSQYEKYIDERLKQQSAPVSNIIAKNNLCLFKKTSTTKQSRTSHELRSLKSNCELFSRMYISCQSRNGDMNEFFRHENQAAPPSLSDMGGLRHCTKSDLIGCVESLIVAPQNDAPDVDAKVLDGSVVVNMLPPKACATFGEYAEKAFIPYLLKLLQNSKRMDVVWDRYLDESLKSSTRQKRGSGCRIIVKGSTPTPKNWQSFLRVDENKKELYDFLSDCISSLDTPGKELYCTKDIHVHASKDSVIGTDIAPCNHEEADTRLILHALHCSKQGYRKILIRTVDTDVVVLAIALFHALSIDELWIAFGVKKHYRYIAVHTIANRLGREKAKGLPFFHAVTGCDTTSSFSSIGKKTAWDTWTAFPEITETFVSLSSMPVSISTEILDRLQRFVVLLYDRTCQYTQVNETRKMLFAKGRQLDRIPPTEAALREHVKRSAYQAGFCWGQALVAQQQLPSPGAWGWEKIQRIIGFLSGHLFQKQQKCAKN